MRCHCASVQGMQANFEMFSKVMEEQLAEQRRKFEEELKKRETVGFLFKINLAFHTELL